MTSVHKVLAEMQKTRPRRARVPGVVLMIFAGLVVVALFIVVAGIGQPLTGAKTDDLNHPRLLMPVAHNSINCHGPHGAAVIVSLSPEGEWIEVEHGKVSEARLREIMIQRRGIHRGRGWRSMVVVRIGANQPAQYLKRIHQISMECGMDELRLGTWSRDPRES